MERDFLSGLPERFRQNAVGAAGEKGRNWLIRLPEVIGELEAKWSLRAEKHFSNLSYNYVAPCVLADGGAAVLKIGLPEEDSELFAEARALEFFGGEGAVRLLRVDKSLEALLLEKVMPGRNLREVFIEEKEKAVGAAITVLQKLRCRPLPENTGFIPLEKWLDGLKKATKTIFPKEAIREARLIFEDLNRDSTRDFLLHGDFHHENILSSEREDFLAIDAKGVIGDPGYEIAVFLNNHAGWLFSTPDFRPNLEKAVRRFSDAFSIKPEILAEWALLQQICAAWWTFEDNDKTWLKELEFAKIWRGLI